VAKKDKKLIDRSNEIRKISLPMFSRTYRVRMNNELISFLDDFQGIEYVIK
jgi:hypothetical protein